MVMISSLTQDMKDLIWYQIEQSSLNKIKWQQETKSTLYQRLIIKPGTSKKYQPPAFLGSFNKQSVSIVTVQLMVLQESSYIEKMHFHGTLNAAV